MTSPISALAVRSSGASAPIVTESLERAELQRDRQLDLLADRRMSPFSANWRNPFSSAVSV